MPRRTSSPTSSQSATPPCRRALIEGLEHDFVADDAEIRSLVPRRLMGLEEAVAAAIEADRSHALTAATAMGPATPEAAFAVLCTIGGPSFGRRRRHPRELRVGDVVDSWRVIAPEPGHLLLFKGLTRAILRRASSLDHSGSTTLRGPK